MIEDIMNEQNKTIAVTIGVLGALALGFVIAVQQGWITL